MTTPSGVTRRTVLAGAGAAAGTLALVACSSDDDTATPTSAGTSVAPAAAEPLAQLADIPVGTAVDAKDADGKAILVAQPTAGTAVAFSAICTHQGCTVVPDGDALACPCHGSVYELTGEVRRGPAEKALAPFAVTVTDGQVLPA